MEYRQPLVQETYTHAHEVDAKIHYHYPKGEFRFPVIPDNISERRKKEPRPVRTTIERLHVNREKIVPIHKTKISESNMSSDRKRPFRPTEIPSPVYGFQKRPIMEEHDDPLEFELNRKNRHSEFIHTGFAGEKERKYPFVEETSADTDIPAFFRKQEREPLIYDEVVPEVEDACPVAPVVVSEPIELPKQEEMKPIFEGTSLPAAQEAAVIETVQEPAESVQTIFEEPVVEAKEEERAETAVSFMDMHEETAAATEIAFQEAAVPEPVVQEMAEADQAVEPEPVAPAAAEERKRRQVPFNVVMLRQDKERLLKQQSKKPEKKTVEFEAVSISDVPVILEDDKQEEEPAPYYQFPNIDYLSPSVQAEQDNEWLAQQGQILNETLFNFNVRASVVNITQGPAVTQFEIQPEPGVKVNKITNLADDIKLCLAAQDIRIEAPIPGKHTIGIEIPNRKSRPVFLREILESDSFKDNESPLTVALGLDITGQPIVTDLRKMPHGLIAGATGSGKSVCINSMLVSLLYKAAPQEVKLLLIDPKMVELAPYNHIPHLVSPVITDVKAATAALKWAVDEMERRYELFAHTGVRDIGRFNMKAKEAGQLSDQLPYIVIVIDELADLMMMSPAEVEESICRIAQKARACGIHLVVATQRPSVDVITGLIKANIPTRIAFSVSSQVDSRTILDSAGADKLLGRGDMLFLENGSSKTVRLQGTFVTDDEIEDVVAFVRKEQEPQYLFQQEDLLAKAQVVDERDELFIEACEFVVYQNAASTSSLQRRFHIGYNRAARLMEILESSGIISEARGSRPREVLMNKDEYQEWVQTQEY
ncbi:MAG: DNA translocase FtsK [Bacillus sp. (in: firmicutes)]